MDEKILSQIKTLKTPQRDSHKGQNGRMLLIGGSELFHAASIWSLTVASRIVDLVHYCSVEENNRIVQDLKESFLNGIVIPRSDADIYIKEDDCILIGPGMTRDAETKALTDRLLKHYPEKQWVIDAGALQMMDVSLIPAHAILTPHHKEFADLCVRCGVDGSKPAEEAVYEVSKKYNCIVLLKGTVDVLCSSGEKCQTIRGGNAGMTKGGTGDVLAGLIAALACTNDSYLATLAGSAFNKQAGDDLFETVGPYFHASDLADQIPKTMKRFLIDLRE